jgi:hypothetical protein
MASPGQIIHIHPAAPPKPAEGQTCNGCGVCCLAEPCPVGILVSRRRHGACKALQWSEARQRYVCGMLAARGEGFFSRMLARLIGRWIAAGVGCDSDLEPLSGQATSRPRRPQG